MKNYIITVLGLLLFVAIALVFFLILRNIVFQPSIVLTSLECDPPCWNGIQPGVTAYVDVMTKLGQMEG